jgi:hypothetical protein
MNPLKDFIKLYRDAVKNKLIYNTASFLRADLKNLILNQKYELNDLLVICSNNTRFLVFRSLDVGKDTILTHTFNLDTHSLISLPDSNLMTKLLENTIVLRNIKYPLGKGVSTDVLYSLIISYLSNNRLTMYHFNLN